MLKKDLFLGSSNFYKKSVFTFNQTSVDISGRTAGLVTFGEAVGVYQFWDTKDNNVAVVWGSTNKIDMQPGKFPYVQNVYDINSGEILDKATIGSCEIRCFDYGSNSYDYAHYSRSDVTYLGLLHSKDKVLQAYDPETETTIEIAKVNVITCSDNSANLFTGYLPDFSYSFGRVDLEGSELFIDGEYAGVFERKTFTKDGVSSTYLGVFDPLTTFKEGVSQEVKIIFAPKEIVDVAPFIGSLPNMPVWVMNIQTDINVPLIRGNNGEVIDQYRDSTTSLTKSIPDGVTPALTTFSPIDRITYSLMDFGSLAKLNAENPLQSSINPINFYNSIYNKDNKIIFNSHRFQNLYARTD